MTTLVNCWLLCNIVMIKKKTLGIIFNYLAVALFNKVKQVLDDGNLLLKDICDLLYKDTTVMTGVNKAFFKNTSKHTICALSSYFFLISLEKIWLLRYWDLLTWIQHFATIVCILFRVISQMKYFEDTWAN